VIKIERGREGERERERESTSAANLRMKPLSSVGTSSLTPRGGARGGCAAPGSTSLVSDRAPRAPSIAARCRLAASAGLASSTASACAGSGNGVRSSATTGAGAGVAGAGGLGSRCRLRKADGAPACARAGANRVETATHAGPDAASMIGDGARGTGDAAWLRAANAPGSRAACCGVCTTAEAPGGRTATRAGFFLGTTGKEMAVLGARPPACVGAGTGT
jgi:hypothetical protein